MSIYRLNPSPRWSDATVFEGIAHFVEVPSDTAQGFNEQLAQLLALAEQTLARIGSDKSHLLSATIYLTDRTHVADLNRIWEAWLPKGCAPSRACVKVELLDPAMLVEIVFVAATVK
jgi:enamine deaminase RidA (YjgF/YER057c/UK114 family)